MHTPLVQVYELAGHAHEGTCTSAIDLVQGFVNMLMLIVVSQALRTIVLCWLLLPL